MREDPRRSAPLMAVRVAVGLALAALFALGGAVLCYGFALHFRYADATDPPIWVVERWFWLSYLSALELFWGAGAASMLWPGRSSARLGRMLRAGAVATGLSGGALLVASFIQDAGRFYTELAGVIVLSAVAVGVFQHWLSKKEAT